MALIKLALIKLALFNLAQSHGNVDEVGQDVARIDAELASKPVRTFLLGSSASDTEKLSKLEPVLAQCTDVFAKFVRLMFEKGRSGVLENLEAAFRARRLQSEGAVEGRVESARALDSGEVSRLESAIGARLGKRVSLEQTVVPELVGGVRVFVGASMIDQSVQGRLEVLRRKMVEAPLPG